MNPQKTTIAILAVLSASIALADDFKTNDGKEHKSATVTRVEADGIVIKTKGGISKLYFTELPKDVQERFHYDPTQAAAAQAAAVRQTQELNQFNSQQEELAKQQKAASAKQYQQGLEQQAKYNNVQALTDQLSILQQQEQNLLVRIGQAEKRKKRHGGGGLTGAEGSTTPQQKRSYPFFAVT
jgi:predicted nucleic acid-binding protein